MWSANRRLAADRRGLVWSDGGEYGSSAHPDWRLGANHTALAVFRADVAS